jgi:RNA polymerase nonessential primary-like sigma factor
VTDADVLLQISIRNRQEEVERLFRASPDDELDELAAYSKVNPDIIANKSTGAEPESEASVRKRVRVAMKKNTIQRTKGTSSRSSTMPGFASTTDRQRAFRDGIRIVEERTGRRFVDTPETLKKRRKSNGEAMYKNSPSVPDSMVQFADEIHQEERITRKEEIELGEKTQEAIRLQNLYDALQAKLAREPTDDEWCAAAGKINMEALGEAIAEGLEAKNKLVTSNLRMVQSVVNTYIRNGLSAQYNAGDLMQEGILALIRAAEKFEPDRGWKFSTYAMYWVRASVKRSQIYQSRIITVPQRLNENHKRLKRIEREIFASTGKKPTSKELGAVVGMSELQVNRCMTAMDQRCYSLDQEISNTLKPAKGDESKETLIEVVETKAVDDMQNHLERVMLREDLIETLNRHLSPEEVEVLLLRYGLKQGPSANVGGINGDRQVTIAELSRMLALKPDKVRRMIDNSLQQLKGVGMEEWLAFERDLL